MSSKKKETPKPEDLLARDNPNYGICKGLFELAKQETGNRFKAIAFRKAAISIMEVKVKIKSGKEAMSLPGIGKSIASIIDEFLETGHMEKSKKVENDESDGGKKPNYELAQMLFELADFEKNVNREIYKHNAYQKVAVELMNYPHKIKTIEETKKFEGVGESIEEKIDEYLKSGKIKKVEEIQSNKDAIAIKDLIRVFGVGPAAAQHFLKEGIRSIKDLNDNYAILNNQQRIGLKYLDEFEKRIPREETELIQKLVFKEIRRIDEKFEIEICGSYRRGAFDSGDIDILLTHPNYTSTKEFKHHLSGEVNEISKILNKVIEQLVGIRFITDVIAFGDFKFMGVCRLSELKPFRRIDIRLFPKDEYYLAVLYFTGSKNFNQQMRKIALENGYTLNEYSLRKIGSTGVPGRPIPISSEEEVFEYLGMEYKRPEERNL